jgi:hypothetical protein
VRLWQDGRRRRRAKTVRGPLLRRALTGALIVFAGVLPLAGSVTPAAAATFTCTVATLNGANETPPNTSPATGTATLSLDTTANTVSFTLTVSGLSSASVASHIHQAPTGVAGPIVVPLPLGAGAGLTSFTASGSSVAPNAGFNVADIAANPSAFYVNVHSTQFPGGEIRGQLTGCTQTGGGGGGVGPTPELSSVALFGSGALGLVGYAAVRLRRRRRPQDQPE